MLKSKKTNILLFLVDALRADKCFGETRSSITPNLDILIKNGIYFDQAISSTDGTFASMGSVFTSQYPFKTGITWARNHSKAKKHFENLKIFGYNLYATVPNYNFFETITKNFTKENLIIHESQKGLFDGIGDLILNRLDVPMQEPWFYYIHIMDLHLQRPTPKEFDRTEYGKTEYERKISAIDFWIGKILDKIDLGKTLVVLTSDHGEYALDKSMRPEYIPRIQKGSRNAKEHTPKIFEPLGMKSFVLLRKILTPIRTAKFKRTLDANKLRSTLKRGSDYLYDDAVHIPLMFSGAGIDHHKIIFQQVRQIDIFPTIAELVGVSLNKKTMDGISLISLFNDVNLEEKPAFIESMPVLAEPIGDVIGVRTSQYKYYRSRNNPKKKVALYDLKKDPDEIHNLAESQPDIVNLMENILNEARKDVADDEKPEELTKEKKLKAMKVLREMGYD